MKKNETWFLVCFSIFAVLVFAIAVSLKDHVGMKQGNGNLVSDGIALAPLPDGDKVIENKIAGYSFSAPANWYVEKGDGADLTVYPDYDPKGGGSPECKMEVSTLAAGSSTNLNSWITNYLHADPTADVVELSRTSITIGVAPAGSAIQWQGIVNGVTTTLVYTAMPKAKGGVSGSILELAPSMLTVGGGTDDGDDCSLALQALIANITFESYAP